VGSGADQKGSSFGGFFAGYYSENEKLNPKMSLKRPPENPDSPMQGGIKKSEL
jgi:hypothetical protein